VRGLELSAVAFSLACVVLAARRHVGTWPAGIVAVVAYCVIFVRAKLYADAALQVVFLGQGIYGWLQWGRRDGDRGQEPPIRLLHPRQRIVLGLGIVTVALAIGAALDRYTDASRPFVDAAVSVLSLAANWLLARRILENWALWLTADALYIGLFLSTGLIASAALYALFLVLAALGWRSWLGSMPTRAPGVAGRAM
jgi:nicotinamide mononucleotide transporter